MFSTIRLKKEGWKEAKVIKYDQIWHIPTSFNAGGIPPTITDAQVRDCSYHPLYVPIPGQKLGNRSVIIGNT